MNPTPEQIARAVAEEEAMRVNLPAAAPNQAFLQVAQDCIPTLQRRQQTPVALVAAEYRPGHALRFHMNVVAEYKQLAAMAWHEGDAFTLDFGEHLVGYLSFTATPAGGMADSPVRLRLTFGEVPTDVAEPLQPYTGWLSAAWLAEEIVTIDDLPQAFRVARRHAFRYVKVEVLAASRRFQVGFSDVAAEAVTSAATAPAPLEGDFPAWVRQVDMVSQITLRDCLQTCFEDGPRRDRRLWVGDLRLQALANYETFRANDVVKRCLYLFAGLPRSDGLVNGCVYERPWPIYADTTTLDYAALYCVTLQEYVAATHDVGTGLDLWPTASKQIEVLLQRVGATQLFQDTGETWCFIDWAFGLDKSTATHGVILFALRRMLRLAEQIGKLDEVQHYGLAVQAMSAAANRELFDAARGVYVSGPGRQVSCASQAWMVLGEVPQSDAAARAALRQALAMPDAVKPITPYLYHYLIEAMLGCGMEQEALALCKRYWGGMLDAGADTFWEAFDPELPLTSPYGDIHVNSYCHAWSCSPAWLFRARGMGRGTQ